MEVGHTSSLASNRLLQRPELNQEQQQREARVQQPAGIEVQISREARNTFASQANLATQPITLSEPPPPSAQSTAVDGPPVTVRLNNEPQQAQVAVSNDVRADESGAATQPRETLQAPQQQVQQTDAESPNSTTANPPPVQNNLTTQQPTANQTSLNTSANNNNNEVVLAVDIREVVPDADENNQAQQNQSNTAEQSLNVSANVDNEITAANENNIQANNADVVAIPNPNQSANANNQVTADQANSNTADAVVANEAEEPVATNTSVAIDQFRQVALSDQERQIIESFDV
ncbi:hypothetical protein [Spartinivicinus ruber]|uniref:hypothetical protein n=1 Tax=Spartinivicinus ruber TaxID=2683272 RepID=UPI0013D5E893|nr:hypothetical protein [Spartinivicinus ruber]